ncbi:Hypothetical protein, predicted lipoprotein [Metamycoplasma auris 15026]|uniref:Transglutaminase-like domain-containing protein n=1 Tax=Metamycoplasma auris 15026 TaxID=1188233 RepID=N9TTA1_9BACT|nr:transglutaminase domain-containing protein [Metamycoplasma auris]ENY69285.1 Hypothetical protein, predicted lipoprotein [Metamycoplasma auris 15026]
MKKNKKLLLNFLLVASFSSALVIISCESKNKIINSNNKIDSNQSFFPFNPDSSNNNSSENSNSKDNNNRNPNPNNSNNYSNLNPTSTIEEISHTQSSLFELDKFYLKNTNKEFIEKSLSEQEIEAMILNNQVPSNFYSHPNYAIENPNIHLDSDGIKTAKLKLIDTKTNLPVNDKVVWYQRNPYAKKEVLKAGLDADDIKLNLKEDGTISGKKHISNDLGKVQVWAYYKGYLYSTIVDVDSVDLTKFNKENNQALQEAKRIASKWQHLPVLEKITEAYKWMTKNVKYDYSQENLVDDQSAYSALVKLKTVCTGYAKGFKMLMDELNVPCTLITGEANYGYLTGNVARHAWNMVEVDGEWYHVDATSDRADEKKKSEEGTFNFFMMHDNDFIKESVFNRGILKMGNRFRNLKTKNYINSKEDAIIAIDRELGGLEKLPSFIKLNIPKDAYKYVREVFDEYKLELNEKRSPTKLPLPYVTYDEITYYLNQNKPNSTLSNKEISVTIERPSNLNSKSDQYALKIKLDKPLKDITLKAGNFIVKNAYVKEAIKEDDLTYTLVLDHFNSYSKVDIELSSIKKFGYKFSFNSTKKFSFEVNKHDLPSPKIESLDENSIRLSNVNSNMEYRNNNSEWKDIEGNNQIINNIVIGSLSIRTKRSNNKLESDIIKIPITKGKDLERELKIYNNNILVGIDKTMEYKNKNETSWRPINTTKMKLNPGEYIIRVKANNNQLASQSFKVVIK